MANMFFAGIPLEGSGMRPLDADLYGADQQGTDNENLAGTGNLNIGNVMQYDEHAQRYLSGGAVNNNEASSTFTAPTQNTFSAPQSSEAPSVSAYNSDDANAPHATVFSQGDTGGTGRNGDNNASFTAPTADSIAPISSGTTLPTSTASTTSSSSTTTSNNTTTTTTSTTNNTTTNNYNDSHDVSNAGDNVFMAADHPLLTLAGDVIDTVGDTVSNVISTVSDTVSNVTSGLLEPVVSLVENTVTNLSSGDVGSLLEPVVSLVENTVNNLSSGDVGGILESVVSTVEDTVNNLTTLVGGDTQNIIGDVVQPVLDVVTSVADPLLSPVMDVLGGVLGDHPLIDLNSSIISDVFPTADNHALINVDMALASITHSTPQAAGIGLVDLDVSALSTPADAQDGLSLSVNLNAINEVVPLGIEAPSIPVIDIPLPTAQSVPLAMPAIETAADIGHSIQDMTSGMLDPVITLAALTHTEGTMAAIDSGVLFTGAGSTAGHAATPAAANDLHVGSLLQSGLFGGHF